MASRAFPRRTSASGATARMEIVDGSLRIRSPRGAPRYIGREMPPLRDEDGFVDTGDMIEQRGDRCHFIGRRGGVINVGGAKVHPEEVEAVINRQAGVRMSLVKARRNPIAGALVVADVVLDGGGPKKRRSATISSPPAARALRPTKCRRSSASSRNSQ